jgi:tricorn protease-like protein
MRWARLLSAVLLLASLSFGASAKLEKTITVPPDTTVRFTAVSPKGDFIVGGCADGQVRLWAFPSGELRQAFDLQDQRITSLTFSGDETLLAVGGNRGAVKILALPFGKLKTELKVGASVVALAVSPDKTLLAVAKHEQPAQLWDLDVGRVITELPAKFSGSLGLDFSPDGQWLASADADTEIRIYESHTGALRATASDLLLETFAIIFASDSKSLYAGGADKKISVIDVTSGKVMSTFPEQSYVVGELCRSADGKYLAAVYFDEKSFRNPAPVIIWDLAAQSIRSNFAEPGVTPNGAGLLKDGRVLVTGSSGAALQIWSVR